MKCISLFSLVAGRRDRRLRLIDAGDELPVPHLQHERGLRRQRVLHRRVGRPFLRRSMRRLPVRLRLPGARGQRRQGRADLLPAERVVRGDDVRAGHGRRRRWRWWRRRRRRADRRHGVHPVHQAGGRHRHDDRRQRRSPVLRLHRRHARLVGVERLLDAAQDGHQQHLHAHEDGRRASSRSTAATTWKRRARRRRRANMADYVAATAMLGKPVFMTMGNHECVDVVQCAGLRLRRRRDAGLQDVGVHERAARRYRARRCRTTASTS